MFIGHGFLCPSRIATQISLSGPRPAWCRNAISLSVSENMRLYEMLAVTPQREHCPLCALNVFNVSDNRPMAYESLSFSLSGQRTRSREQRNRHEQ